MSGTPSIIVLALVLLTGAAMSPDRPEPSEKPPKLAALAASMRKSLFHETNSRAASRRGVGAFEAKKYGESARAFSRGSAIRKDPALTFGEGTAEIAAGNFAAGSALLSELTSDPANSADAYFNRGNSALLAKAFDHAIHDFTSTLKLRPDDRSAKRNLEIALRQKSQAEREKEKKGGSQSGNRPPPVPGKKPPAEQPSREEAKGDQQDPEGLLRSVGQQEKEELARMQGARPDTGRIGW